LDLVLTICDLYFKIVKSKIKNFSPAIYLFSGWFSGGPSLNIPGYAAGTNPWGNSSLESSTDLFGLLSNTETYFDRQDFGDRKIEIVGLSTAHMATIHMGFSGYRIAQCHQLRIELSCPMTAQIDGEPFYLPTSVAKPCRTSTFSKKSD
jgi:hypothetical protein